MKRKVVCTKALAIMLTVTLLGTSNAVIALADTTDANVADTTYEEDIDALIAEIESEYEAEEAADATLVASDEGVVTAEDEAEVDEEEAATAEQALTAILADTDVYLYVYRTSSYKLLAKANASASSTGSVVSGDMLTLLGVEITDDGKVYYQVKTVKGVKGYILGDYVVSSSDAFNDWIDTYITDMEGVTYTTEATTNSYIESNFPSSYWSKLKTLAAAHPNWTFVAYNVDIAWDTAVANELVGERSLIYYTASSSYKNGAYSSTWYYASKAAVEYYMNPVNYMDASHIFAFEALEYDSSTQTSSGLSGILSSTFMKGETTDGSSANGSTSYADIIMYAGQQAGVSPYHLAARIIQEQGSKGTGILINTSKTGGYYNYFNIGASGSTDTAILTSGVARAKSEGWKTVALSIVGGATFIGKNYISVGQNTLYFEKYDVVNNGTAYYTHQYMQNVSAAYTESVSIYNAYVSAGALESNYVFRIPVYSNMPTSSTTTSTTTDMVNRAYNYILGRSGDTSGVAYYVSKLSSGSYTACQFLQCFYNSSEFKARNLSNTKFVTLTFNAILARDPSSSELSKYVSYMDEGCTRNWVINQLVTSSEFSKLCSTYGIKVGSMSGLTSADTNQWQTRFVYRLYKRFLGRSSDSDGLIYWTTQLQSGHSSWTLVKGFYNSSEFQTKLKTMSDGDYVETLYKTLFGRGSDPEGKAYWVNKLKSGTSRYSVLKSFANSSEWKNICTEYGITRGTIN